MFDPASISGLDLIQDDLLTEKGITLHIKRDDQLHPFVQGNKFRKLKYNIATAISSGRNTLLTFGGPYSNHIYSTAAAGKRFGLDTIGIIRGYSHLPLTPTLRFAADCGMQLVFCDKHEYAARLGTGGLEALQEQYPDAWIIPEGGSNQHALRGVAEIVAEVCGVVDLWCTAVGTGGTLAGLLSGLEGKSVVMGISALKGENRFPKTIATLLRANGFPEYENYSVNLDYHFGGYGKITPGLLAFMRSFRQKTGIQLDPVYTGKMMYGLFGEIVKGNIAPGSRIVALHTGGLQGIGGYKGSFPEVSLARLFDPEMPEI